MPKEPSIAEGALAGFLNRPVVVHPRMGEVAHDLPYVHVSDLIKNKADTRFCLREFVLRHYDRPTRPKGAVPPKMGLLWDTGNLIGDHLVINKLIASGSRLSSFVWGDWRCVSCGAVVRRRRIPTHVCGSTLHTVGRVTHKCTCSTWAYKEVDLRVDDVRLVGHPDLLLLDPATEEIIIYEIKTIDRTDISFDGLTEPLGDHLLQASYYYYLLRKLGYKVSRRIRFLYIDRSIDDMYRESPYLEFTHDVLPVSRIQAGIDLCKQAMWHIQNKKLPARICGDIFCARASKCTTAASCFARHTADIQDPTSLD